MSPDPPPPCAQGVDVHRIWFSHTSLAAEIAYYLWNLIDHYSNAGATVGPGDWYVSQVEAYKNKDGLRHELLLATVQLTPRLPSKKKTSSDNLPGEISIETRQVLPEAVIQTPIHYFIIERRVDGRRAKEDASQPGPDNPRGQSLGSVRNGDRSTFDDSIGSKWKGKKSAVQFVSGRKPALDEIRRVLAKGDMSHAELISRIDLPAPPILPPDDDYDSVYDELSKKVYPIPAQAASAGPSSSATPATPSQTPRFLSLTTLLCLADTISQDEKHYSIIGTNCYWYCSTILYSIRQYMKANIILPASKGSSMITIAPTDPNDTIRQKVNKALVEPGSFGIINIVPLPEPEKIDEILALLKANWTEIEDRISRGRLTWIKEEREKRAEAVMLSNKRAEAAEATTKQALTERDQAITDKDQAITDKDQAITDKEAERKRAEEAEKRADEAVKRAEDAMRKMQELLALKSDTTL